MKKKTQQELLIERMVNKSVDAFMFAIEIINKPSMKYRTENFVFNICNAWELLLKAQMVRDSGEDSIYFKNDHTRTRSFTYCIESIFTDAFNPIKNNINLIKRLRNLTTHLVTPEYDNLYVQFFQANILYYVAHIKKEFNIDINELMPSNFLTIAANTKSLKDVRALTPLDKTTFNRFLKERKLLQNESEKEGMAVTFDVALKSVKKGEDYTFRIASDAETPAAIIKQFVDPNNTHPYRGKDIISTVNEKLGEGTLNQYSFRMIKEYENIEASKELFYYHQKSNTKLYSQKALDLIVKNIKEIPNYVQSAIDSHKKSNPRS